MTETKREERLLQTDLDLFIFIHVQLSSVRALVLRSCQVPGVAQQINHSPKLGCTNLRVFSASFHELSHSCLWMCSMIRVMGIPKCRIMPGLPLKQLCMQQTCCFHKSGKASIRNHLKCHFFYLSPVLKPVAYPEILYHIYKPLLLLIWGLKFSNNELILFGWTSG